MPLSSMLTTVDGHWELQAAALLKAVWWGFRLADGLVCALCCSHSIQSGMKSLSLWYVQTVI